MLVLIVRIRHDAGQQPVKYSERVPSICTFHVLSYFRNLTVEYRETQRKFKINVLLFF